MTVDNEIYDREAAGWWSEDCHLSLLEGLVPVRIDYLKENAATVLPGDLHGATVLDVGCGGGLFAEALASLGCRVTGVDPSAGSIDVARRHAGDAGLAIDYLVAAAEALPQADASFAVVVCCDVLEHVDDLDAAIRECARVLEPGGMFLYDTVNRTWFSKLIAVQLLQNWEWLRMAPPNLHDPDRFIRPHELEAALRDHGLEPRHLTGISPPMNPFASLKRLVDIRRLKRGRITFGDLGRGMVYRRSSSKAINYMGYAVKRA